ncbi:DNA/RNA non-specific endonuclease [Parabacteroides sp. PF5-9]|uniref:DNA/RNA non-specific endonuclease n=1 Tax=Parabacteroides sp. PF5-9 TaxID=1742404 RepID=UPI0024756B2B|nr:DNA/RNA non-specific endonuclease [Parabacteroides sp. PF5-9]MDH6358561.1 endonuclease G [Parabacteroides sp. PF5-9]
MAKKATKPRSGKYKKKKKGKAKGSFFASLKQLLLWAIVIALSFIGLLFLYNHFYPDPQTENIRSKVEDLQITFPSEQQIKNSQADQKVQKTQTNTVKTVTSGLTFPKRAEIPRLLSKRKEIIVNHEGYTVSYNSDYKIANWVAWELTASKVKNAKVARTNKFLPDPQLKSVSATDKDYSNSGYDRGHMAPAGDMKWSEKAMKESFYLSNICPQDHDLNQGLWRDLEELCRLWAIENNRLLIACGPIISKEMKRVGINRVGVPTHFYKVICMISDNKYEGIAFVLENKAYKTEKLFSFAVPIDSVETLTGIDFFHLLPDELETQMEARINEAVWSF